ncbi:MAG: hypothetical protein GY795_38405 [Desulfobacterales bacterium]|nr:hypothetical protein [Desulfobacterales bacterium]
MFYKLKVLALKEAKSMLECTGFKVDKRYINPFNATFICRTKPDDFAAMDQGMP